MELIERALGGERLAVSRLLSEVENDTLAGRQAVQTLFPRSGHAHVIGITGPSGSGKSTLVNRLALELADERTGENPPQIAVVAVDPSSPFSGGALLGDRVRMRDLATKPNIFIRSMATRGALGGLARTTDEAVLLLDALGFAIILVETVGAGQSEIDIVRLAHTCVVVEAPGLGDDMQAAKAGILEIADVLVVNKADKPGADGTAHALEAMLSVGMELTAQNDPPDDARWQVPVLKTSALEGSGVNVLKDAIMAHLGWLKTHGGWQKKDEARLMHMFEQAARDRLYHDWLQKTDQNLYQKAIRDVRERKIAPSQALDMIMGTIK